MKSINYREGDGDEISFMNTNISPFVQSESSTISQGS